MADDDVTALLSGKKKRKKHKRKRCRVVKRKKLVHGKRKTVKVRKCKPRKKAKPKPPVYAAPAFVPAPPVPPPPAPPRLKTIKSPIAVYAGAFGPAQAERLAWRAGFGPRPGQVGQLAALDLEAAVMSFTRPTGDAPLDGPEPMNGDEPDQPGQRRRRVQLLARPHGPLAPPARRAARARVPRLVGDPPRRRRARTPRCSTRRTSSARTGSAASAR